MKKKNLTHIDDLRCLKLTGEFASTDKEYSTVVWRMLTKGYIKDVEVDLIRRISLEEMVLNEDGLLPESKDKEVMYIYYASLTEKGVDYINLMKSINKL